MDECKEPLNPKKISLGIIKNELKGKLNEVPQKQRKRIMAFLDIIVSVFVVAPLVVSCWRGIWIIMDIYYRFFPAYETFFFAIIIHLGWALMKDILHESFQYRKKKVVHTIHWQILRRIYTYIFTILCNMHWRATWLIMDEWTEVVCLPDGRADSKESNHVLPGVWLLACIVILSGMKSVRNVMGCPFFIFLDDDESFLFPTRFRVQGFYLTIFLLKQSFEAPLDILSVDNETAVEEFSVNTTISNEQNYENTTPLAEKLMSDPNPHPFHNNFRGPPPASFIPLPNQHYPQLQNYVRPGYPRNIQEIINYIHPEPQKPTRINFANHDPFHSYKPKDPSDINLLATANLRFAPPIWKDLKTNPLVPAQSSYKPKYEGKKLRKPIQLTLNVFPMPHDGSRSNYFGFAGGSQGGRTKFEGGRGMRARKMVIHLNFYSEEEDEEIEKRFLEGNFESLEDILSQQEEEN